MCVCEVQISCTCEYGLVRKGHDISRALLPELQPKSRLLDKCSGGLKMLELLINISP